MMNSGSALISESISLGLLGILSKQKMNIIIGSQLLNEKA